MADDKKIIFSMVGVSKTFAPQKRVLNNIYLSFFYGAKIGIIGLNGAGKSTLLKIIAGIEKNYEGEVVFSPGYSVGYLEQDPQLDPEKTVRECVQEGVQPIMDMLAEYDAINMAFAEPDADFDKLLARQTTQKKTFIVLVIRLPRYPKQFTDTVHRISGTVFCMKLAYCLGPAFFRMEILNMSSATSIILLYNSARMCSVLRAFCKRATSAWSLA